MLTTFDHALKYLHAGFSVIPLLPRDKKPAVPWTEYQRRMPTEDEIKEWFVNTNYNIGIVTGAVSGIAVVDLDSEEAIAFAKKHFPLTPLVKTAKGYHAYYRYREGVRNFQKRDDLPGIDLRGDGGYVVAPPSVHPTGKKYQWERGKSIGDIPIGELPNIVLVKESSEKTPLKELYKGTESGCRNDSLARLAGSWVNDGLSFDECIENAFIWNSKNNPPLPEKEVIATVRSIYSKHYREKKDDNYTSHIQPTTKQKDIKQLIDEGTIKIGIGDLLETCPDPVNWIVDGLIAEKSLAIIDGLGASGKSILMLQLAMAVASGSPIFGRIDTKKSRVLYLNAEDPINEIHRRIKNISMYIPEIDDERDNLTILNTDVFNTIPFLTEKVYGSIKQTQFYDTIKALCEYWKPELIIIDPLSYFLHDENSSDSAIAFYYLLRQLKASVILVHHQSKAAMNGASAQRAKARGSSVLVENVRTRMSLEKGQLIVDKNNYGKTMELKLVMQGGYWSLEGISNNGSNVSAIENRQRRRIKND